MLVSSPPRIHSRAVAAAVVLGLALAGPGIGAAHADKPKVLVRPFAGGPEAMAVEQVVIRSLSARYEVVTLPAAQAPEKAAASKRVARPRKAKGKARGKGTRGESPIAAAPAPAPAPTPVPADVLATIDGAVVKKRRVLVAITPTAAGTVTRLSWPVNGSISRSTLERIAVEVPRAVDKLNGPGAGPSMGDGSRPGAGPQPSAPGTGPGGVGAGGTTTPGLATTPGAAPGEPPPAGPGQATPGDKPADGDKGGERPSYAPYFEIGASLLVTARRFSFEQAGLPSFSSGSNAALALEGTLFPFARQAVGEAGAARRAIAGLGVGVSGELHFRPDSVPNPCLNTDGNGDCKERYATSESRIEGGLRWRWNVSGRDDRPDLRVSLEYGAHQFSIAKRTATRADGSTYQTDVGASDVDYRYLLIGLGTRLPVGSRVGVEAQLAYEPLLGVGPIGTASGYGTFGSAGGYGLRGRLGLEVRLVAGLNLGVHGFYEHVALSLTPPPAGTQSMAAPPCGEPLPCGTTGGASDDYFGGGVSLRYRY